MVVDAKTRAEIEKQARLYDAAKEEIVSRIRDNIEVAIKKLQAAERKLLDEVEIEFGENPFINLLTEIDSDNPPTDAEVKSALENGIPQDFGPSEESFFSLYREIEAFKSWSKKEDKLSAPSNFRAECITQEMITLTWDDDWKALSYQVEVDGNKSLDRSITNTFTKTDLLPDTEHSFRVRAVRGNSVSEWSDVVKGRTQEIFKGCMWKECPNGINKEMKYSVDVKNARIVTKTGKGDDTYCTIIGDTPLPINKVTSWNIKVLKSKKNEGFGIIFGVAPSDIDQNEDRNFEKCGWNFNCYASTLFSGPPHRYDGKEYGPRKEKWGEYVHTGDSVGVVMDTAKGELSFVVNGVNLGVAYEGIPLDKPLVPYVNIKTEGDSVELVI